jgi:casein kinase 1
MLFTEGVPLARHYSTEGDYNVLVMDVLGKSLEALFEECGRKLSLHTVLCIADQLLLRIESIHRKSLIHRDIKPDNFLVGRGENSKTIYAVDFGLSKLYLDPRTNRHIFYREGKNLIGTVRYASLYTHMGIGIK